MDLFNLKYKKIMIYGLSLLVKILIIKEPKFFLYTGTESDEEKEILRNIYNSEWDFVPTSLLVN